MGRLRKYFTEEQKKEAIRRKCKRYYLRNREVIKEKILRKYYEKTGRKYPPEKEPVVMDPVKMFVEKENPEENKSLESRETNAVPETGQNQNSETSSKNQVQTPELLPSDFDPQLAQTEPGVKDATVDEKEKGREKNEKESAEILSKITEAFLSFSSGSAPG